MVGTGKCVCIYQQSFVTFSDGAYTSAWVSEIRTYVVKKDPGDACPDLAPNFAHDELVDKYHFDPIDGEGHDEWLEKRRNVLK